VRDAFNVPHIYGKTDDAVTFGAGWALAQDRTLLLEQARYNSRVAVVDAPGLEAIDLIVGLKTFQPSAQTEREVAKEEKILRERYGRRGKRFLHDIDVFVKGINAQYRKSNNPAKPWALCGTTYASARTPRRPCR
jgi:acyl-homoserine lactone acylase PvdQ